jgi:hypothetical protein
MYGDEKIDGSAYSGRTLLASLLITFLGTGCLTTSGFDTTVKTWHGADVNRLVSTWGAPRKITPSNEGTSEYEFSVFEKTIGPTACIVWIKIDASQKIVGHRFEGAHCKN